MKQRVIVAMSGGVDSSVAAALLKRAGGDELRSSSRTSSLERVRKNFNSFDFAKARVFDVIGVFMKFWSEPRGGSTRINADINADLRRYENRCCSTEAEVRARKVAKILKIPFYVFNVEKEFKKRIVDYFLREHKRGRTPNPCVVCNKEIKFGLLLKKALKLDADFVATGHYARIEIRKWKIESRKSEQLPSTYYSLLASKDKNKDQSYFLWQLNQKQLSKILFPIGDLTRKGVEKLAKKFKLPVLDIRKSVEICFIKTTINDFLKKYLKEKPGPVVEQVHYGVKKIVGKHRGLWFYTIGQRKGIKLPGGPYWVLDKDIKKNILIVTRNEKDLYRKELIAKKVNWVARKPPKFPLKVKVKIRYRHQPAFATITKNPKSKVYSLRFKVAQKAITPGQSVVFYHGNEVLGGGIIY